MIARAALLLGAVVCGAVLAQEPPALQGRVGCTLAWDFPPDQEAHVAAFPIFVDGVRQRAMPATARTVPCADIGLDTPGTYTLELFTRALPESGFKNSERVTFAVTLVGPRPTTAVPPPARTRLERP